MSIHRMVEVNWQYQHLHDWKDSEALWSTEQGFLMSEFFMIGMKYMCNAT